MKKKYAAILSVVVLAVVLFSIYGSVQPPRETPKEVIFITVEGGKLRIEDFLSQGKPVLIYFFTTWCPTCESDLKALNEVYGERDEKMKVLVVSFDPTETSEQIKRYKENRNYTWPFAVYNEDAVTKYNAVTQATKIGISKDGEEVFFKGFGVLSREEWESLIQQLTV